jgi:hypothetical protein
MYLRMIDFSFLKRDAAMGEKYLASFETLYPGRIPRYIYINRDIEKAYGSASMYYFRLGQNRRSLEIINKGLEYVPDSYDLQNRQRALK